MSVIHKSDEYKTHLSFSKMSPELIYSQSNHSKCTYYIGVVIV